MNHVSVTRALLFIFCLLSSEVVPMRSVKRQRLSPPVSVGSTPSQLTNPFTTEDSPSKKLTFNDTKQVAVIEETDLFPLTALEDSPECDHFAFLNESERQILKELNRLGVRTYSSLGRSTIHLKYIKNWTPQALYTKYTPNQYDEAHHLLNFMDSPLQFPDSVWAHIAKGNRDALLSHLISSMDPLQPQLFSAYLIISRYPDLIALLPEETFKKSVFVKSNACSAFKHFIFPRNPQLFMKMFTKVYRSAESGKYQNELRSVLSDVLVDLKISDETVQTAFDTLLSDTAYDLMVLNAFIMSRRSKLTIEELKLQKIIFSKPGFTKGLDIRISLLNLNIPNEVIEKIISLAFSMTENAVVWLNKIFSMKSVVSRLNLKFLCKSVIIALKTNRFFVNFDEIVTKAVIDTIFKSNQQIKLILNAIQHVKVETFSKLINLRTSSNIPIFSRQHLIESAALCIGQKRLDLLEFLLSNSFILPHDKALGTKMSLLAIAVHQNNIEFVKTASDYMIDLKKCSDAFAIEDISDEMKELLQTIKEERSEDETDADSFMIERSPTTAIGFIVKEEHQTPPHKQHIESVRGNSAYFSPSTSSESATLPSSEFSSPKREYVYCEPKLKGTPLIKIDKSSTVQQCYSSSLNSGIETELLEIFKEEGNLKSLKEIFGIMKMAWELFDKGLLNALNVLLRSITVKEEIHKLALEANEKKRNLMIKCLIASNVLNINETIGDRCIIGHLFKAKNPELAFELMNRYNFDIKHSDSPDVNPEGDIILSAAWSDKLVETLIQMGANSDVKFYHVPSKGLVSLLQWAQVKGKTNLVRVLTKYAPI